MKQAKRVFLSFLTLLFCTVMYAQTTVSGTVVDETEGKRHSERNSDQLRW